MENNLPIVKERPQNFYDFIIVGQGLAGTLLHFCLRQEGRQVLVIDKNEGNASRVAAGMFNLVIGRRLSLAWRAKETSIAADSIYTSLEKYLSSEFYHKKPIVRIFASEDDFLINQQKFKDTETAEYIKHFSKDEYIEGLKNASFGICEIKNGGYLDTQTLLQGYRNKLAESGNLLQDNFDFDALLLNDGGIAYKGIKAKKIIFCEGYQAIYNPYFSWLPFNLAKGDVLTIEAPGLQTEKIINKGIYIVPLRKGLFKVGATYQWQMLDVSPTAEARQELETELQKLIDVPYRILAHEAGIRPTVKQRRPFLGLHPEYKKIGIFNGLGTRGVILAPLLAQEMAAHIIHGKPLHKETDISFYNYT